MYFVKALTVSAVLAALVACGNADPAARIVGGQDVDSLRQFPFFVYITFYQSGGKCGGSILNAQWVLTSATCIKGIKRLELSFGKKNEGDYAASYYSISVNSDQIYVYPTNYDDLALIRLPIRLVFSDTISPVNISTLSIDEVRNKLAVMPGFNELPWTTPYDGPPFPSSTTPTVPTGGSTTPLTTTTPQTTTPYPTTVAVDDSLKYGMFNIVEQSVCRQRLGAGKFDEYNQLCAQGWGSNPNTPCEADFGSGLIIGWPSKSELVGLFSVVSPICDNQSPAVYAFVPKYLSWINSMIQG